MLPQRRVPWYEFVFSYGTQAVIIAIFVWVPLLHPEILETSEAILSLDVADPSSAAGESRTSAATSATEPVLVAKLDPPPAALRLPAPQPQPKPKVEDAPAPEVKIARRKLDLPPAKAPVIPQTIKTNNFSTRKLGATDHRGVPAEQVQTGGFGDPNGVPAKESRQSGREHRAGRRL